MTDRMNQNCENGIEFKLAHPPPGEEIVVSGLAGKFPDSDDAYKFRENLFNKVDLVSDDERRWVKIHEEIPQRIGKLNDIDKFDAGSFGLYSSEVHCMDPMTRILIEKTVEAIIDAGFNPNALAGTNTGVYVGICASETEKDIVFENKKFKGEAVMGCMRNQAAERISYHLKLNGPSFICDTACSSSAYALELAYREMRLGKCDQAIVGGVNLCLFANMSLQFARLGMLSPEGVLRAFDEDANGYVRSEAVCAVLLQKEKDAKRIYCRIIHAKVNSDGYKSEGITYPSGISQAQFLEEFYKECEVCPSTISFLEAHGTGTKVGDPEEVFAIASVFCKNRSQPLLMGSVKSNIGHSEPTSGLCSLTKVIFAMETGYIPPNINFKTPKREITALHDGRISIVTEKTPWIDNMQLAAVNNFGFGGANCHFLMAPNPKFKINDGEAKDDLPRLICVSGRTEDAVNTVFDDIVARKFDAEYIALFHEIFANDMQNEKFRGFLIVNENGELKRSVEIISERRPIFFMLGGFEDEKWLNVGKNLMLVPTFANAVKRFQHVVKKLEARNVFNLKPNKGTEHTLDKLFAVVAVQIGLFEILKAIDFEPDYFMGHNQGELVCAFHDGLLTLEQMLTALYHIEISKIKNQEESNFALFTKFSEDFSKILNFTESTAIKWIRSSGSSNSTLLNMLLSSFQTQDISNLLSDDAIVVHFGAKNDTFDNSLCLIDPYSGDSVLCLLESLGRLYENGVNMSLAKLYPEVQWPVSKGTPMISPIIKWEYSDSWYVARQGQEDSYKNSGVCVINTKYNDWAYLKGHVIDGSTLFPAAGYLYLVWDIVSENAWSTTENYNIVFENVKFLRASNISRQEQVSYNVSVKLNGEFEVTERDILLVTGKVSQLEKGHYSFTDLYDLDSENGEDDDNRISLSQKDIYKELKLRGYNYTGAFRGIKSCNNFATHGTLKWEENWITFIDSMLQINILQEDTRKLYVPTGIGRLLINSKKHNTYINDDGTVNVNCKKEANITACGGVEIVGLSVSQILRRKIVSEPVLESYEFVPNEGVLSLEQSLRVNTQIILENIQQNTFKIVEVLHSQTKDKEPLCRIIQKVLADQPLIQPDIKLLSDEPLDIPGIVTVNESLSNNNNNVLVIAVDLVTNDDLLKQTANAIHENGYIISRQALTFKLTEKPENLEIITSYQTQSEVLILLKKYTYQVPKVLNISDSIEDLSWVTKLQELHKPNGDIMIVSQNIECNGIQGFINCLRREPGGLNIRCALLMDNCKKFAVDEEFYKKQLKKGLAMNVYKNGKWGTYRHLLLKFPEKTEAETAFVNVMNPGDLSSLTWIEGPLTTDSIIDDDKTLIQVYYSALNFRDILTASGRLPVDIGLKTRVFREGYQGLEFAGRDLDGKRVFGMSQRGALSTLFAADSAILWKIPDEWTMAEAVTVPVVYSTVLYSFVTAANIQRGHSILIHAGSGGIGQAAIHVALYYGCTVFTTVGTKEKKAFILKHFPQIKEEHIGNSRDTSFEQMVFEHTNGRGVDIALNSLTHDKLLATVRCIAKGGTYIEIGKMDLISNNELGMQLYEKQIKATGVMLDLMFELDLRKTVARLVNKHVVCGAVKPLHKVVYKSEDIEAGYRFMASGKHMGKVVIKLREEETVNGNINLPTKQLFQCKPIFYCNPDSSYIIIGGLGGIGLEIADWLIVKGCRKLILVSRHGLRTGYQALRIRFWEKYASVIHVSMADVITRNGCVNLITKANEFGSVDAIFNLAVDLMDAIFENQTLETFLASLKPKAIATYHLDQVSRQLCPNLRYFVVFSSASAGRGNLGQTNYGLANGIMENICEKRRSDGFPALAIQWGAVGDVGLVADMNEMNRDVVIGGTLPQRISSCLEVLDKFLCQDKVVVSSMVVAEKTTGGNIEEVICNILGIKDMETVNIQLTFPELGMDSITGLEIKQVIERQFDVMLTPQEMKSMTFLRLKELSQNVNVQNVPVANTDWLNFLLRHMSQVDISQVPSVQYNISKEDSKTLPEVSFLPGIDGMSNALQPLLLKIKCRANVCHYLFKYPNDNIRSLAKEVIKYVKLNNSTFTLIAYSFGCLVALEVIAILETEGYLGKVIFIDGSLQQFKSMVKVAFPMQDEEAIKTHLLMKMLQSTSFAITKDFEMELEARKSIDEKIDYVISNATNKTFSTQYLRDSFYVMYNRITAVSKYERSFMKLKSEVTLLRPKIAFCAANDYELSDLFENPVEVKTYDGDHESILSNNDLVNDVNDFIQKYNDM